MWYSDTTLKNVDDYIDIHCVVPIFHYIQLSDLSQMKMHLFKLMMVFIKGTVQLFWMLRCISDLLIEKTNYENQISIIQDQQT